MRVHRSSGIAFGLLALSGCVALGDGIDPVDTQVAQAAEDHSERSFRAPIESPNEQQDKRQHKSQIGSTSPAIAPGSDAGSRPASIRFARLRVSDDRGSSSRPRSTTGVLRAIDLAGKPFPSGHDRAAQAQW